MPDITTISIGGKEYPVAPLGFCAAEELLEAHYIADGKLSRRIFAAAVGLATPACAKVPALSSLRYDLLSYGGLCYDHLRGLEAKRAEIEGAGASILASATNRLFPREQEVAAKVDFTVASEDGPN